MRLDAPRVPPLAVGELDPEVRERIGAGTALNIFRTLAHHPKLLKRWMVFANHVLAKSEFPARERELAILRVGWKRRAGYEWGQHAAIARGVGVSDGEIRQVAVGPDAPGWSEDDRALLRAVDELIDDAFVSDETWKALEQRWELRSLLDLIFTVGQYDLVCMALNTLGVQPEPGVEALPEV